MTANSSVAPMYLHVDPHNGIPIFEQLVRQIKYAIADGVLVPGQLIPSVRDLSRQLALNPNTVHRALQQLQAEELLEPLRGRGLVVCRQADRQCRRERQVLIRERLQSVVDEGVRSGIGAQELRAMFERILASTSKASRRDEKGAE